MVKSGFEPRLPGPSHSAFNGSAILLNTYIISLDDVGVTQGHLFIPMGSYYSLAKGMDIWAIQ